MTAAGEKKGSNSSRVLVGELAAQSLRPQGSISNSLDKYEAVQNQHQLKLCSHGDSGFRIDAQAIGSAVTLKNTPTMDVQDIQANAGSRALVTKQCLDNMVYSKLAKICVCLDEWRFV